MSRGPSIHLGYHNNADANAQAFNREGWFRTGDLGRVVDADGNVQITGRSKEIINRGGKKFFPCREILYTHPAVLHVAMIGMPDVRLGERNCLCVVPKSNHVPTLDEFVAFLRDQVADYKLQVHRQFNDFNDWQRQDQRHVLRDLVLGLTRRYLLQITRNLPHAWVCGTHPRIETRIFLTFAS